MKKNVFSLVLLSICCLFASCTSSEDDSIKNLDSEEISWNDVSHFDSKMASFNKKTTPLFKMGRTRSISEGDSDGFILSDAEKDVIEEEVQDLTQEAMNMFLEIGFTEDEIYEIIDKDREENLPLAALLVTATVHDQSAATRVITGNTYLDCAIIALGGDFYALGKGLFSYGMTKAMAKAALKVVAKRLGGPISVALAVAEWGLCVGGLG